MNKQVMPTRKVQVMKKRRLEREISWVKREFHDFTTLSDIDLYNTERYAALHLGISFI
ncbi:MAG: hypothetical protein IJ311_01240 [Elusimicrobiaceae bacterium]|nr:hypothetical protein [Elusimicrobiaceae bacterium]